MGVGFLHGVLPQGLSWTFFISPTKIQVFTTDEILFPIEAREELESELNVKFSVTVLRDWDAILANTVASPSVDLIFLPSYWANTLAHQNLLMNMAQSRRDLRSRVASDFLAVKSSGAFHFLPFYWMKMSIETADHESFVDFLKNKNKPLLFLLADEDLLLKHFEIWKSQGLSGEVLKKKILTLQLDQLIDRKIPTEGALHVSVTRESKDDSAITNSLLIWGAAIPANSPQRDLALKVLDQLTRKDRQEKTLLQTPFNSAFSTVTANNIPLYRRAEFIRSLTLKDTILIETKNRDAKTKLKNDFNLIL